jgi:hypothetical protein
LQFNKTISHFLFACSPAHLLHADVPAIIRACARQLKEKNPKTRMAVFGLMRELMGVAPAPVAEQLPLLVPGITAALSVRVQAVYCTCT